MHPAEPVSLAEPATSTPSCAERRRPFAATKWVTLAGALLLGLGAMCANHRQVFPAPGKVFFVDADCYARMTRVRAVCEQPGLVLKEHDFENAPVGTRPHTTVPLDYATAMLRAVLWPIYGARALDLAGAWISPLFGLLTLAGVWYWGESARLPGRGLALLVLAASPIVAHGFELGRPDHQSLVLACMAFALAAEWRLWQAPSRAWGIVSGAAWALGLWTSLYEPVILLVLTILAAGIWNRAVFRQKGRLPGLVAGGFILLAALWIEGWRIDAAPGFGEGDGAEFFAAWSRQIGELASVAPWAGTLYAWTGLALVVAPVLLLRNREERAPARANLLLLAAVFVLTCWQLRWGYFLPLAYALSLPYQFGGVPQGRWRLGFGAVVVLGLWPLAHEWVVRLNPPQSLRDAWAEQRAEADQLREVSAFIRQATVQNPSAADPPATAILAPWWLSPPLAYWSGQPAVAGSSHEALPGTVDVARFYLATDARKAAGLLRRRRVRWVVAYEPARIQGTSADLLGLNPPPPRFMDLALYERPQFAPRFLRLVLVNPYFKMYEVRVDSLPHE